MDDEKMEIPDDREFKSLYEKSKNLIDNARSNMGQMANAITVLTSFLLGRYSVEQEQQGAESKVRNKSNRLIICLSD